MAGRSTHPRDRGRAANFGQIASVSKGRSAVVLAQTDAPTLQLLPLVRAELRFVDGKRVERDDGELRNGREETCNERHAEVRQERQQELQGIHG